MQSKEAIHLTIATLILSLVIAVPELLEGNWLYLIYAVLFGAVIIGTNVLAKKTIARAFDSTIEHEVWNWSRFGFKPEDKTSKPIPVGVIIPLLVSAVSLGMTKVMTLLTYETSAHPSGKRKVGGYVFSEMTDWHIALFGAIGIGTTATLTVLTYFILPTYDLWRFAAFYAFWNCIPVSKLDGAQILYGSKVLWTAMMIISIVLAAYGVILA